MFSTAIHVAVGGAVVVEVVGGLDMLTVPILRVTLAAALRTEPGTLVVDLARLTFIDAKGIGLLVELHNTPAVWDSSDLVIANTPPQAARLLRIVQLADVLPFQPPLTPSVGRHGA